MLFFVFHHPVEKQPRPKPGLLLHCQQFNNFRCFQDISKTAFITFCLVFAPQADCGGHGNSESPRQTANSDAGIIRKLGSIHKYTSKDLIPQLLRLGMKVQKPPTPDSFLPEKRVIPAGGTNDPSMYNPQGKKPLPETAVH